MAIETLGLSWRGDVHGCSESLGRVLDTGGGGMFEGAPSFIMGQKYQVPQKTYWLKDFFPKLVVPRGVLFNPQPFDLKEQIYVFFEQLFQEMLLLNALQSTNQRKHPNLL